MLDESTAIDTARHLLRERAKERPRLDKVYRYTRGHSASVYVPEGARGEYRWMVERARVNVTRLVVTTVAQNLYVEGYRPAGTSENAAPWATWQANRMDARQHGVHRGALKYGIAYVSVLPGDPVPVINRFSPRRMTAVYDDPVDDEWPLYAIETRVERTRDGARRIIRLYDDVARYRLVAPADVDGVDLAAAELVPDGDAWVEQHDLGVCPIVRFVNVDDLDEEEAVTGEVEPIIDMQDQINQTTFHLLMAQQYAAFRQRWATGVATEDEDGTPAEPFRARVDAILINESTDAKFGDFAATDLGGYLESREATLRHVATVTQVPPHNLLGQMANLSAEALNAARDGLNSKVAERKSSFGESWEQVLRLCGLAAGDRDAWADTSAQVVWRDVESRSLAQTVDAWGKAVQMLGVPAQEVWERIPGVTQTDVERWRAAAAQGDALARLDAMLARQLDTASTPPAEPGAEPTSAPGSAPGAPPAPAGG